MSVSIKLTSDNGSPAVLNYPVVKAFLAGSFSGTFSTVLFQPLDLVKTRLQNPSSIVHVAHSNGMVTILINILQRDHLRGLWRGISPSITRCVPGVGLYFCSLDLLRNYWIESGNVPSPIQSIALGMTARSFAGVLLIPITVVKTRFESDIYSYNGVINALRHIYRTEGVRGLTCGLAPTLFRDAPFSGLYYMFYTQNKQFLLPKIGHPDSSSGHFACGLGAGILASVITQPADVFKTKMQLYPEKFSGLSSVVIYVYDKYGVKGYFKGLVPRMLRRTLMAAMAWTVYERLSKAIGL